MKSRIYTQLTPIVIAAILAACSAASPDDKKEQLEKLKTQQVEITDQIAKLQAEIDKAAPDSLKTKTGRIKDVAIIEVKTQKFDHYIQTQGSVDTEDNVQVSAKSPGIVTNIFVKEGQQVSKGQVLAQVDNSVIVSNIGAQKAQLELATAVYDRQANLWKQKIGTEVQYLQAKTNKESLEKQIQALEEQNEMTKIKAPLSGTVDEVIVKIGENIAPGMPAVRVVNTSNLKIKANVSETYVTAIEKNNKVIVSIPELGKDIETVLNFVGKNIDPLSRTFSVEAKLPANAGLRPNMTAVIRVVYNTEKSAIVVPVNVVQNLNGEKIVYTAEQSGGNTVARKHVVTIKGVFDGKAQVDGLKDGDKIITVGFQGLNDGDLVRI